MGQVVNGEHPPCTKAHWCENHCPHRDESEAGAPNCDCDQFEDDEDDEEGYRDDDLDSAPSGPDNNWDH